MQLRPLLAFGILIAAAAALQAQQAAAIFSEVNGKVEYQAKGSDWKPARIGDAVHPGDVVSTGFKSSAVLKIGQTSIAVKAITRLTLEELVKTAGGTSTTLYLLSGRVKADVPPQPGETQSFKITSATATASVRGTSFEFDGVNLIVDRGTVQLATPTSQFRHVGAGQFAMVTTGGFVPPPAAVSVQHGLDSVHELIIQQQESSFSPPPSEVQLSPPVTSVPIFSLTID